MSEGTCTTAGHEEKPEHGKTGLCQACYRKKKRRERGLKKPGRKPDPSKPFSRYGGELTHHGKRPKCENGHEFVEGSFKLNTIGRRICLVCIEERKPEACPFGHKYVPENIYTNNRGWILCRTCVLARKPVRDRLYKYKLSPEKFQMMLESQRSCCPLCFKEFDLEGSRPFCVDHDHNCCPGEYTCGECVRGLLCDPCNKRLHDDIDWHERAINYLGTHRLSRKSKEEK